jgi:putative ABC transport system permease protein
LNILGLAVAFAVFFAIVVQTYYDFSFDKTFEKADNIYLCSKYNIQTDSYIGTNTQTPEEFAKKFPEIKNYCFTNPRSWVTATFEIRDSLDNMHEFAEKIIRVSGGFFDMFMPGKIIMGDTHQIDANNGAMLTESISRKFFGNRDPLGRILETHFNGQRITATVVAICRDFPDNCSFENGIYLNQPLDFEGAWGYTTYMEIIPGSKDKLLESINKDEKAKQDSEEWQFQMTALPDIHFKFPAKGNSLGATLSLLAIGLWLMIIAYINFINFSMSMSPVRIKSLNIRRIMGENPLFMKISIAMESVFISFVAFLVSILFIMYCNTGVIKEFFHVDLSLSRNINPLLLTAVTSMVMGFTVGIYPAFYSTCFKPAMALSGSFSTSLGSRILKNGLIVIQFVSTIFLIITASFIKIQHDYMQSKSWGIDTENVVYFQIAKMPTREAGRAFESELRSSPDVIKVARSYSLPGAKNGNWNLQCMIGDVEIKEYSWTTCSDILRLFDIPVVEGRDFEKEDTQGNEKLIVNQAFVKKYGFREKDMPGTQFPGNESFFPGSMTEIIGVMEDFNFQSLKEPVKPMVFATGKFYSDYMSGYMLVKINGQNTHKTIDYINDTWKKYCNEYIDLCFLDETLDSLYEEENNLAKLLSICGLITIIVAIMGVYGLILFNVKLKRKTIALHKINGASVGEVILMLNRGFIVQFAIAYAVAVPVAYIVVNRWLENFAYKTPVHWWVFVAGGLLVFLITALTVSRQSYRAATANPIEGVKSE